MNIVNWEEGMSVGHPQIDGQHKKLIEVINDLSEAVRAGKGAKVYEALFAELADYFTQHFSTEEDLMLSSGFPGYEDHRRLHVGFTSKVKELHAKAFGGDKGVSEEMLKYLINWLIQHDINVDKELGAYLAEQASPPNARGRG
jgi:hemerythrin